jgi:phage terminase small subunit
MPRVTPRQTRFVQEYAMDRNATRSAVAAGFSRRTAGSQGARLLKNVNVRAAVAAEEAEVATRIKLSHDDILRDLIALRCAAAEAGQFAAVRATEMIGRHIGMWPPRVEVARLEGAAGQQAAPDTVDTVGRRDFDPHEPQAQPAT